MMGPNVYIVPPGAFTWFHIDGGGPVDSGHQALTGLNEVYMLRRLGPTHNQAAVDLLRGDVQYGLGDLAHNEGTKPPWPSQEAVQRAWDAGMAPSHVLLYPGDYLHIGKGRLHAFRKLDARSPVAAHFAARPEDKQWLTLVQATTGFVTQIQPQLGHPGSAAAASLPDSAADGGLPISPWTHCTPPGDALSVCISVAWDYAYMGSTVKVRGEGRGLR
jgi:hypothetical protein